MVRNTAGGVCPSYRRRRRRAPVAGPARDALERAATRLFEVGGASATLRTRGLDRHGRNARVLVSHNPLIYRARLLGDRAVNGTPLGRHYRLGG